MSDMGDIDAATVTCFYCSRINGRDDALIASIAP
jgi:hypothetical protein